MNDVGITTFAMVIFFVGLAFLVYVLIGIYVYRDAKSRNMDAALWTLLAIFIPSFIGLIIYFFVRGSKTSQNCPGCKSPIVSEYALCPYCGKPLKDACPSCASIVESGWKICPKCGTTLPPPTHIPDTQITPKKSRAGIWMFNIVVIMWVIMFLASWYTGNGIFSANDRKFNIPPAPALIHKVEPSYPEAEKESGMSDDVILIVSTGENGVVRRIATLQGRPEFAQAAIKAVGQWQYEPVMSTAGKPMFANFGVSIKFLPDGTVDSDNPDPIIIMGKKQFNNLKFLKISPDFAGE